MQNYFNLFDLSWYLFHKPSKPYFVIQLQFLFLEIKKKQKTKKQQKKTKNKKDMKKRKCSLFSLIYKQKYNNW